ncbi:MAG TPA: sialidase family protein [Terriglobales bacterium]|nr:sialidase family protein [Terriglobales bacterium]
MGIRSGAAALAVGVLLLAAGGCGGGPTSPPENQNTSFPPATIPLAKLSADTFVNSSSQHATEVEPARFSYGSTIITTFQVGRIFGGGAADIGYAISNDNGVTWQNGLLPGITSFEGAGADSAASDTSVIFDAKHGEWLIASLGISTSGTSATSIQILVSGSSDGGASWGNPVVVSLGANLDKPWITCDNSSTSPHYGNCYMQWDDAGASDQMWMSASSDGGLTWTAPLTPTGSVHGLGGQPLVQPNGTVVVPFFADSFDIESFSSSDGGASWTQPVLVSHISAHAVAGGLRFLSLPSAAMDALGNIYAVWADCSFRAGCASNDLVMSSSSDGAHWSSVSRVAADSVGSTVDHFIPGIAIDPTTSGSTAHIGITYYYYPVANCTASTCALYVGFISSGDGGNTWSAPTPVAGPMSLSSLPSTDQGSMVGDYIATSFAAGKAYGFFAVAKTKSGSTFDEAIYTTQSGFDVAAAEKSVAGERRMENAAHRANASASSVEKPVVTPITRR